MTEPEEIDEDLFADLYEGDEPTQPPQVPANVPDTPADFPGPAINDPGLPDENSMVDAPPEIGPAADNDAIPSFAPGGDSEIGQEWHEEPILSRRDSPIDHDIHGIGIKEDGKMFIGGLNWETTDQSLKDYFSQFGEVQECTVMRDAATGRSRGFGFLTFRDPKTVNIVMVKEHFLDGKIIDPKRAIPRDEQEKTSKIFVGGVSQEATEQDFKEYFMQYGRVIDATLMMDKDTGRPRGFGFVTFDSEAAVEATLEGDLRILGKPIEVKKAQPRGDMRAEEERGGRGRRGGREGRYGDEPQSLNHQPNPNQQAMMNGMSPTMMVQYFQKMQQFMAMMAAAQGGSMGNPMAMSGMAGMNPAMMQQMKMAQMQAMQQQMQQMQGNRQGDNQQGMQGMPPQMVQQMMQMQSGEGQGNFGHQTSGVPTGPSGGGGNGGNGSGGRRGTPGYNAQEQLAFEQQKYEQQQRRVQGPGNYQQGGPTSWEGMYDDVPQPNTSNQSGGGRGGGYGRGAGHRQTPKGVSAPANAPTGPRNAGVPGANYRGGGRGGHRGNYHPYRR